MRLHLFHNDGSANCNDFKAVAVLEEMDMVVA